MRPRHPQAGLTLIEVAVVLAILGMIAAATVMSVGAVKRSRMRKEAHALAATMRSAFDHAMVAGRVVRVSLDLAGESYQVESTEDTYTMVRARPGGFGHEEADEEEARGQEIAPGVKSPDQQALETLFGFSLDPDRPLSTPQATFEVTKIGGRKLESLGIESVWTPREDEPRSEGTAWLYYFPQGQSERAVVFLDGPDRTYSLVQEPLTGSVRIVNERIDVGRDLGERDDLGKRIE